MLVLSRKLDEKIMIGDSISVMVVAIRGNTIRLGIDAPANVPVHREEIYRAIQAELRMQASVDAEAPQEPTAP